MDIKLILTKAVVTALEAALALMLSSGLTDLSPETLQSTVTVAAAAGLSVIYNALVQFNARGED